MMKNIFNGLLLVSVGILAGMMLGKSCSTQREPIPPQIVRDTTWIVRVDTHYQEKPVLYKVTVRDTLYMPSDSDTSNNTNGQIFVHEIKQYQDSVLTAQVSGINATLDWYKVSFPTKTQTITNTIYQAPSKWSIGIQGGYGITPKGFQPYLGIGLQYRIEFK